MVTTRSMARQEHRTYYIHLDHFRAFLAIVPVCLGILFSSLGGLSDDAISWVCALSVPWVWIMMDRPYATTTTTCPFWWYVTALSLRAILIQAEVFLSLHAYTLPILILKLHALASMLFFSMFMACHLLSTFLEIPRPIILRPFQRLAIVY